MPGALPCDLARRAADAAKFGTHGPLGTAPSWGFRAATSSLGTGADSPWRCCAAAAIFGPTDLAVRAALARVSESSGCCLLSVGLSADILLNEATCTIGRPSPDGPTNGSSDCVVGTRCRAEPGGVSPRLLEGPGELDHAFEDGLGLSPLT